jgi:uncharacterized phage protein (TIGR02218 family)
MKTASSTLIANLKNNSQFYRADLYTITLTDGTVITFTTYNKPITTPDARTFNPTTIGLKRTRMSDKVGLEVTTLQFTITARDQDTIEGIPVMEFLAGGGFTGALIKLETAVMLTNVDASAGVVIEGIWEISGADAIGRSSAKFTANALTNRLKQLIPKPIMGPSCQWVLYSPGCGLDQSAFAVSGTVRSGTTANKLVSGFSNPDGYFTLGKLQFTSGAGAGRWFSIRIYATGNIYPIKSLGFTPAPGDTFTAYPGCDKTVSTCKNTFNNLININAYPNVPVPEAAT